MNHFFTPEWAQVLVALSIIGAAFISEDAATITAATLAATMSVDVAVSFVSAVAGLWIGDLGVYAVARWGRESWRKQTWYRRATSRFSFQEVTAPAMGSLAFSRFLPGSRLPAYIAAGLGRMDFGRFAAITATTAVLYAGLVFEAVRLFPHQVQAAKSGLSTLGVVLPVFFLGWFVSRSLLPKLSQNLSRGWQRIARWEFWPPYVFYAPVVGILAWLAVRYRTALPTAANPGQKNGGLIGESKIEILQQLRAIAPEKTAESFLISQGEWEERFRQLVEIVREQAIPFPFVMKPDTAQRGAGFRKITSMEQAQSHLRAVDAALVLQRYAAGPLEAGVFYYRFPGWRRGRIFGITRKVFPEIVGDGVHSIGELIEADDRARFMRAVYERRLGRDAAARP